MSCATFEVSEDIAQKVANLESRVFACEASLSGRTCQMFSATAEGLVASRVAALESSALSDTTNANANTPSKKPFPGQKLSRYSPLRSGIAGDNKDMSDFQQQLNEATLLESSLREGLLSTMSELAQHERCVARVESHVNGVGEAIERLTALLGVKERRITEFGASIGEASRAVELLSTDVEKQLESVAALTKQMEVVRLGDGESARNAQTPGRQIWQALGSTQDLVMQIRDAHAQGLQDVKDSVDQTMKQHVQHMVGKLQENTDSLDSSAARMEKQQVMQQLIDSQLRETENDKRIISLEERLDGMAHAIEVERVSAPKQGTAVEHPRRLLSHVLPVQPHVASCLPQSSPPPRVGPAGLAPHPLRIPQRSASPPAPRLASRCAAGPQRLNSAGPRYQTEQSMLARRPSVRSTEDTSRSPSAQRRDNLQVSVQHFGSFPTMAETRATTPLSADRLSAEALSTLCHTIPHMPGCFDAGLAHDRSSPKLSPSLPPRSPYITHRLVPGMSIG